MGRVTHSRRTQNPKTGSDIRIKTNDSVLNSIVAKEEQSQQTTINNIESLDDYKEEIIGNARTIEHTTNEEEEKAIESIYSTIANFVSLCHRISSTYNNNNLTVQTQDLLTSDLLHEIELEAPKDLGRAYKCYAKLRQSRRLRRRAKNENKMLYPLLDFIKQNPNFVNELTKIKDRCAGIQYDIAHSVYTFKSSEDIE